GAQLPEFLMAFSIPLRSLDDAKAAAEKDGKLTQLRPGVYQIGKRRSGKDLTCNMAASLGDAPTRLVCGQRDRDLEALLPWMTRGMPTATVGTGDIHIE